MLFRNSRIRVKWAETDLLSRLCLFYYRVSVFLCGAMRGDVVE